MPFHTILHHSTLFWNRAGIPRVPQCFTSLEHCGTPPTFTDAEHSGKGQVFCMFHSIPPLQRAVEHLPNLQMMFPLIHFTTYLFISHVSYFISQPTCITTIILSHTSTVML